VAYVDRTSGEKVKLPGVPALPQVAPPASGVPLVAPGTTGLPDDSRKPLQEAAGTAAPFQPVLRISNGVELNPKLPDPAAGLDYTPKTLNSSNPNIAYSQRNGYRGELELANRVADLPNEVVVKYGDIVGSHGSDVISVNAVTGDVTLWDAKWRSGPRNIKDSTTFAPDSRPRAQAIQEATYVITQNQSLSPGVKDAALRNLQFGNITTRTAGSGAAKNSRTGR
jgi:filamentous hemagglutinin